MALLDRHFRYRVFLRDTYNILEVNCSLWRRAVSSADMISTVSCRAATGYVCQADWPTCNSGTTLFCRRAFGWSDQMANTFRGRLPAGLDYSNPRRSVATGRPRRVLRGPVPPSTGILPKNWNTRWSPSDSPAEKKRCRLIRQRPRSQKTNGHTHTQNTDANSNRGRIFDVDPLGEQVAAVRKVQERIHRDRLYDCGYAWRTMQSDGSERRPRVRNTAPSPAVRRRTKITERATTDGSRSRGSLIRDNTL